MSDLNTISGLPAGFQKIALFDVGGLPVSFYYGVILVLGFGYLLAFTPLGRHMRFVGASREVSRLSGVRVDRIRFGSFVFAGPAVRRRRGHRGRHHRRLQRDHLRHLPAAGLRRGLPQHRDLRAGPVQPARHPCRHLLPRDGHPRPPAARPAELGLPGLLRRHPGDRGDDLHPAAPADQLDPNRGGRLSVGRCGFRVFMFVCQGADPISGASFVNNFLNNLGPYLKF